MWLKTSILKLSACLLIASLLFTACTSKKEGNSDKKKILASTGMIADVIKNLVKDDAEIQVLIATGLDPHSFTTTHGDLVKLKQANLVFYNGLHLEGKIHHTLEGLPKSFAVSEALDKSEVRKLDQLGTDPHIWLDVVLWTKVTKYIATQLQKELPELAEKIKKNEITYVATLEKLNLEVKERIDKIPVNQRVLITSHDAFGYFGARYGIKVMGIKGFSTTNETSVKRAEELAAFIVKNNIKTIFPETSTSPKDLKTLIQACKSKGATISLGKELYSDSMGPEGTPGGTYEGMIKQNVSIIESSLK